MRRGLVRVMSTDLLEQLRRLEFDSLTAKQAVEVRAALGEAVAKGDRWMAGLMEQFGASGNGRPPALTSSQMPQPVKPLAASNVPPERKRRGRPVPELKVEFKKGRKPEPIAVGGADAEQPGPKTAQLFQDSYVSHDGPRPGSQLPPDHPRRSMSRESSITPEVDMSDFHEVEEEMRKSGSLGKIFQ